MHLASGIDQLKEPALTASERITTKQKKKEPSGLRNYTDWNLEIRPPLSKEIWNSLLFVRSAQLSSFKRQALFE